MSKNQLEEVCRYFNIGDKTLSISPLTSGHINDTFTVETDGPEDYVLQRLNKNVFTDPKAVVKNKVFVSKHIKARGSGFKTVEFLMTTDGEYFHKDSDGQYWNMMCFIPDAITHVHPTNRRLVNQAGNLLGNFMVKLDNIPVSEISETLPKFHNVPYRLAQFEEAVANSSIEKKEAAMDEIANAEILKDEMSQLEELREKGTFPIRILHNDTKISNMLFNDMDEGIAVIDLDTVMPGIVHYDFGDAVRSMCSNRREDDRDIIGLMFNLDYYRAFCEGYVSQARNVLSKNEKKYLTLGIKTIIYVMGLRFLTDYLNNNIYYKVDYENHNLIRCKNQFALLRSVFDNFEEINKITDECLLNNIS